MPPRTVWTQIRPRLGSTMQVNSVNGRRLCLLDGLKGQLIRARQRRQVGRLGGHLEPHAQSYKALGEIETTSFAG